MVLVISLPIAIIPLVLVLGLLRCFRPRPKGRPLFAAVDVRRAEQHGVRPTLLCWSHGVSPGPPNDAPLNGTPPCCHHGLQELTVAQAFNASTELQRAAAFPLIRLFTVGGEYADSGREYRQLRSVWQDWSVASPQALGAGNWTVFSAACWCAATECGHVCVSSFSLPFFANHCGTRCCCRQVLRP